MKKQVSNLAQQIPNSVTLPLTNKEPKFQSKFHGTFQVACLNLIDKAST